MSLDLQFQGTVANSMALLLRGGKKSHEVIWLSLQGPQRGEERSGSPGDENSQGIRARDTAARVRSSVSGHALVSNV